MSRDSRSDKELAIAEHAAVAQDFAARYDRLESSPYENCFLYSRHRLNQWLWRYLPADGKGLRALDLGCGSGHYLGELRQHGFEAVGVDGAEPMLELARANNPGCEIVRGDAESIPFPDANFDYVICLEVVRYLPQTAPILREMARVLRPGGICLVTALPLLNANGFWLVNTLSRWLHVGRVSRLRQFFTTGGRLRREMKEAGFTGVEVHGVYLGPVNWVERLIRSRTRSFLRAWEGIDRALADRALLREFSNMFLAKAVRRGRED